MSLNLSTIASVIIGATAITGSALAVNVSSAPQESSTTNTVMQPQQTLAPIDNTVPSVPGDILPISPTPTPSELPTVPPPTYSGDDEEDDDDENYEDEDGDDHEDYDDEYGDYEDESDD